MVDFVGQRKGHLILPLSDSDAAELLRIPERRAFTVSISPGAVPLKLQRWYRAGVQLLVEATGRWPNRDVAHREIIIRAGFFESFVISTNGNVRYTPASTAGWGLVEWREFIDRALPILLEFAGESRADFRARVDRFFGIKFKEAYEGI